MMHTEQRFLLNTVYNIFNFNYISQANCKIDNSKHLTRFWRAPVLGTCGYQGNERKKVEAARPKVCIKVTLQEDKNISWRIPYAYAKDDMLECMCLNRF